VSFDEDDDKVGFLDLAATAVTVTVTVVEMVMVLFM
jgi:hypothetical protein